MKKLLTALVLVGLIGTAESADLPLFVDDTGQFWATLGDGNPIWLRAPDGYSYASIGDLYDMTDMIAQYIGSLNMNNIENTINNMEEKAASGIATSNALAGLDNHLDAGKSFGFGIGTGYHNSQGGVAVGGIVRTTTNSALNFGAAVATGGGVSAKAGWNMQF